MKAIDLIEIIQKGDDFQQYEAVKDLVHFGSFAVPYLLDCLQSPKDLVREAALDVLHSLGQDSAPAIPALKEIIFNRNTWVWDRFTAVGILANLGPMAGEAVPALLACIKEEAKDEDERWLRLRAAHALWRITGQGGKLITVAVELLNDPQCWLRSDAAELLGELGSDGLAALPALKRALAEEASKPVLDKGCHESVRKEISAAIQRIESGKMSPEA